MKKWYESRILPRIINRVCACGPAMKQRAKIVPHATGRVLEIGIGSGLNLSFYNPDQVERIFGIDPSAEILEIAQENLTDLPFEVELFAKGAESIPLEDKSIDTIIYTYTLCTIPDLETAFTEMRRVLKPGGQMLFCEHGKAPDIAVQKWQNRIQPLWKPFSGGCHLNRDIPKLIEQGGFSIQQLDSMYIPGPKFASFNYWGSASVRSTQ
ncbi:MAG: class I SAM-dependent methyltransferase [Bacteroidota bacterium]